MVQVCSGLNHFRHFSCCDTDSSWRVAGVATVKTQVCDATQVGRTAAQRLQFYRVIFVLHSSLPPSGTGHFKSFKSIWASINVI